MLSPWTFRSGGCTPHLEEDREDESIWSYFITDMVDVPSPWVSYIKSIVVREEYSTGSNYRNIFNWEVIYDGLAPRGPNSCPLNRISIQNSADFLISSLQQDEFYSWIFIYNCPFSLTINHSIGNKYTYSWIIACKSCLRHQFLGNMRLTNHSGHRKCLIFLIENTCPLHFPWQPRMIACFHNGNFWWISPQTE